MSYVRFGDDSNVYVFGSSADGDRYIECCGCILTADVRKPRTDEEREAIGDGEIGGVSFADMEWDFGPVQHFRDIASAINHLLAHRDAGHKVPDYAISGIRHTDWVPLHSATLPAGTDRTEN